MEKIKLLDIIVLFVPCPVVTKKVVQLGYAFLKLLIAYAIDNIQPLACVQVI